MGNTRLSLAEQIEMTITAFMDGLPRTQAQIVAESFAQLQASNVAGHALDTGASAPDFRLLDASGTIVGLYERLASGPVA